MAIREDYEQFPFESKDRGIWYFEVNWENKSINEVHKQELKNKVNDIIKNNTNSQLIGVWQGTWRTDIFKFEPKSILDKL